MKNIFRVFIVFIVTIILLAASQNAFAQKAFNFQPDATVIINDSVVIRLNDYDGVIQWQKSSDLQLWDNIPGATQDTLLFVADTTTYFRAEVIAGDCDAFYSDTTLLHVVETGVTDIDGNFYPSVIIGNQEWMAENLRVTNDANGNPISRYCYNHEDNMCLLYGGLYTWHTTLNGAESSNSNPSNVQGICPTGWHVPSDAEWDEMVNYIITEGYPNEWYSSDGVGNVLKSCRQTSSPLGGDCDTSDHPYWIANETHFGTDAFGFSALPAAGRYSGDTYYNIGFYSEWWSSTISDDEYSTNSVWTRALYFDAGHVTRHSTHKGLGISVRCVRDIDNGSPTTYTLNLQVLPENFGQISGEGEYIEDTTVTITATPNENYQFVSWAGDTDHIADVNSASTTITMPAQDVNLTANFETGGNGDETQVVEVLNPVTGRIWMDRNLGASRAATSSTDTLAYGHLYQWGRSADGHQKRTSGSTTTLSYSDTPGHGDFIFGMGWPYDWRNPQNTNLWQGVNGINNPCPTGYRLPTDTELNAERDSWSINNDEGAFTSPLKLTVAGFRSYSDGALGNLHDLGVYSSSTVVGDDLRGLNFSVYGAGMNVNNRADGLSVRCIKDEDTQLE